MMYKTDLFFDIETIPLIDPVEYSETMEIVPPANYKNQEAIDRYIQSQREGLVQKITKDASLNPLYGKVISATFRYRGETYSWCEDIEDSVLSYVDLFIEKQKISWETTRLVTFNGKGFDVPFVNIRAGYELIPNTPKYNQEIHLDVYLYLTNFGSFSGGSLGMSQAAVAKALGIPPVSGSGAEIYGYYKAGKYRKIVEHNTNDVEQLEKICQKLKIAKVEEPF